MKKINWFVHNGDILPADWQSNREAVSEIDFTKITEESMIGLPDDPDDILNDPTFQDFTRNKFIDDIDPAAVTTYTGEVLYIGQEDQLIPGNDGQPVALRQIKFIVREASSGLIWSLLPVQVRYVNG